MFMYLKVIIIMAI